MFYRYFPDNSATKHPKLRKTCLLHGFSEIKNDWNTNYFIIKYTTQKECLQMKCFIHKNDDGIAVCTDCGKAMCANCSSHTNHSGICPECKKELSEDIRTNLQNELKTRKILSTFILSGIIFLFILGILISIELKPLIILFSMFFVGLLIALVVTWRILYIKKQREQIRKEIVYLTAEIDLINDAEKNFTPLPTNPK